MDKISTLFQRSRNGAITENYSENVLRPSLEWVATEKLNGVNVRVTVRSGTLVRLEVRKNPSAKQKEEGVVHSWYRDASPEGSKDSDYWLWVAARNTSLVGVPDGEWAGEAVGPKIQGNSLELEQHIIYLFSLIPWRETLASSILIPPVLDRVPVTYEELEEWLPYQASKINDKVQAEGVVWWFYDEPVAKIKVKDFNG